MNPDQKLIRDVRALTGTVAMEYKSYRDCIHQLCDELEKRLEKFDLFNHLVRQRVFSENAFGPVTRKHGVVDHIRKELLEIEKDPKDLEEWIDIVILGFDGAWRTGATPRDIIDCLVKKQEKNERREWPDWRKAEDGKAIEHVRGKDA